MTLFASPHLDGVSVMALDTGRKLGFAVRRPDGTTRHGVETLPGKESGVKWRTLWGLMSRHAPVDFVYIERNHIPFGRTAVVDHGRFIGVVECWAEMNDAIYREVAPSTIKLHATGNGRAAKADVIFFARTLGFQSVSDDNHADALALLDYALADIAHQKMLARAS
jgi:Holliday junction resolvasome RuvABC endonuclease subunit